ncbi:MAG: histidine kinase [Gemmiger sp.]|nr:histidine kinase [Gemmiger sp.]
MPEKPKKMRTVTLRVQTFALVLAVVLPLMGTILLFNTYTVRRSSQRVYESGLSTLGLYCDSLESDLHNIENQMINLAAKDIHYQKLRFEREPYERYSEIYEVFNRYQEIMNIYPIIGAIHLYSEQNEIRRTLYRDGCGYSYAFKQAWASTITTLLGSPENPSQLGWFTQEIDGRLLLLRIFGRNGLYMVFMVDPQNLQVPQGSGKAEPAKGEHLLIYATADGTPMIQKPFVEEHKIDLRAEEGSFYLTGSGQSYLVSALVSSYSGTKMFYLQPYGGLFGNLDNWQLLLLLLSLLMCGLTLGAMLLLNQMNLEPMTRLIRTITRIREGQADARMAEDYHVEEYHTLSHSFNEMVGQIQQLRIESYEQKLAEQNTRLLMLQSQIKPHFYLNLLKNIQALAQEHQDEKIQALVMELSVYLRYLLQTKTTTVALDAELESVSHYIQLQRLTTFYPPQCEFDVPEALQKLQIPPLSILTFVENAVKYAVHSDCPLQIHIKGRLLQTEDGHYYNLTITDNGGGFSPEILAQLNSTQPVFAEGHVGIPNVLRRFELIYRGKSSFAFSNMQNGSCIEIFIPAQAEPPRPQERSALS